jgi:hypothetical protein
VGLVVLSALELLAVNFNEMTTHEWASSVPKLVNEHNEVFSKSSEKA